MAWSGSPMGIRNNSKYVEFLWRLERGGGEGVAHSLTAHPVWRVGLADALVSMSLQ